MAFTTSYNWSTGIVNVETGCFRGSVISSETEVLATPVLEALVLV